MKHLILTAEGRKLEGRVASLQRAQFAAVFEAEGPAAEKAWRAVTRRLAQPELASAGYALPNADR